MGRQYRGRHQECGRLGFDGIEPFRQHILKYLADPAALKKQCDAAGIAISSCSNGGGKGFTTNFIDRQQTAQTVKDHVAYARDFILPVAGPTAFKFNMGRRPDGGVMTDDHIKIVAETLNEIGRQTIAFGIKAAPHPHLWGPLEREHEVRLAMELTDPAHVFMTADTAHLTLGGMDPLRIITDYYPRVAEIHYKDCLPKYRGNTVSPTPEMHHQGVGLYSIWERAASTCRRFTNSCWDAATRAGYRSTMTRHGWRSARPSSRRSWSTRNTWSMC